MNRLLQLSTYGMKNIENMITIDFSNSTLSADRKVNNVKGIFGYNGAGKSALMTSIDIYKSIVVDPNYLLQNETKTQLDKLINYNKSEFYISMVFECMGNKAIKHSLFLKQKDIYSDYIIQEESISLSIGRTLNESFKPILSKKGSKLIVDELYDNAKMFTDNELNYSSIVQIVVNDLFEKSKKQDKIIVNEYEKIIFDMCLSIFNIDVYLLSSDRHKTNFSNYQKLREMLHIAEDDKNDSRFDLYNFYDVDEIVPIDEFRNYEQSNKRLEKFIQLFKPELKKIELVKLKDGKVFHIRKEFVYNDYNVELEFESSGIKQLVKLFAYLERCANGCISFIDEIDTNINTFYFKKLISFFKLYGKGQLIFTTHNVEAMDVLRSVSKSIVVLGNDNKVDTWVSVGNKSPIRDYLSGRFPNSPMNLEDFDFINIFQGEEE